jgi:hypothetical protein
MRRFPLIAASAVMAAGLGTGIADSATAAKPPTFTTQDMSIVPSVDAGRCAITLDWDVSDPAAVESYHVQANNIPLKGKNTVQGNVITETTSNWEIDDDTAFYMKVTIILASGRESKSWSVGSDSWSCLP